MPCPGCRDENPQHAKFCLECGRPSKGTDKSGPPVPSYADLQHALSEALGCSVGNDSAERRRRRIRDELGFRPRTGVRTKRSHRR
jgi:hypothetical protein